MLTKASVAGVQAAICNLIVRGTAGPWRDCEEPIQTLGRCTRPGRQAEVAGADRNWTENPDREKLKNSIQQGTREMSRPNKQKSDPDHLSAKIHKRLQT